MDTVIQLIKETRQKDAHGVMRATETSRTVYARIQSITRQEFFEAGRNGLNPEMMFIIFQGDYEGERKVGYNGLTYAVYRTYHVPGTDDFELYVQREGGTNGAANGNC